MVPATNNGATKNGLPFPMWLPTEPPGTLAYARVRQVGILNGGGPNPPTTKAAAKRKFKKKQQKRAPESADEKLPRTGGKNAGRQYTAEELDYALCKPQLARMLERDPILSFIRPKLISELTGPIQEPDWDSIADVRAAVHALFRIRREAGFVIGAFEMEKVLDWELTSWKDSIRAVTGPAP
ncbi:unnamed protein product [Phytophthora fragariaefolia]|uniref:Unnamed protein product n=1 Tax=Phytophthora fragariaefolia TaxID=1490495 RepID=A0A9W6XD31_9STRA|nr:unnamed protein product [Phytophthora fragariaefolia]